MLLRVLTPAVINSGRAFVPEGMCVLALYSSLVVMAECVGCLVEMVVFTMMGVIVNAGTLLKYVSLVILVVVYSYDSFNNVEKKYLKLNKFLFEEVKKRIKDLEKVRSLYSTLIISNFISDTKLTRSNYASGQISA